ncbi:MAG: amidohydrolase family protein [Ilumatobacteraceae bacterium]
MTAILLRRCEVDGRLVDVRWRDGRVLDVTDAPARPAAAEDGWRVVEGDGGAVIPGLHDHHIHLLALAAARGSTRVGPPEVTDRAGLSSALMAACRSAPSGWVRAVGYHESVAGDIDAETLDRLVPAGGEVAIRVQHRGGQLWVLNRRAVALARLDEVADPGVERDERGVPTGRVLGLDDLLRGRVPGPELDLGRVARELAGYGTTGITDLTPTESIDEVELLAAAARRAEFPLRVTITGGPGLSGRAAPDLLRGPVKFLPADHAEVDVDALASGIAGAHRADRVAAVHCVSRVGLVVAVTAFRTAGVRPGDRIEHGAVVPPEMDDDLRDLGLTVVTQPNFVGERGDEYLADVDPIDVPHLWRSATLADRAIPLAGGTDAPFGHPDPWRAIAAAIGRRTPSGRLLGADDRLAPADALGLFLGSAGAPTVPRRIAAGQRTDLCLLDRPLRAALEAPTAAAVVATIGRAGVTAHRA